MRQIKSAPKILHLRYLLKDYSLILFFLLLAILNPKSTESVLIDINLKLQTKRAFSPSTHLSFRLGYISDFDDLHWPRLHEYVNRKEEIFQLLLLWDWNWCLLWFHWLRHSNCLHCSTFCSFWIMPQKIKETWPTNPVRLSFRLEKAGFDYQVNPLMHNVSKVVTLAGKKNDVVLLLNIYLRVTIL